MGVAFANCISWQPELLRCVSRVCHATARVACVDAHARSKHASALGWVWQEQGRRADHLGLHVGCLHAWHDK